MRMIAVIGRPSIGLHIHPYNAGTEHTYNVSFSPTRQMPCAPSVMRREEFGESHEG